MSDEIKIKVGVRSAVKAGMDDVVKDINKGGDEIEKTAGNHGKGFSKAFLRGFKGDFSGGIETIMSKMGIEAESWKGKAIIWGAGIGTSIVAGFKAGKIVDEMFGISDKIAKAWNRAAVEAGEAWDKFRRKLRDIRLNQVGGELDVKNTVETDQKAFEIRERDRLKGMTGREKVEYYREEVETAQRAVEKNSRTKRDAMGVEVSLLPYEEQQKRVLALEEAKSKLDDAQREAAKEEAAIVKKDYEDRIANEKELAKERKNQIEILEEFDKMQRDQDADDLRRKIQNIHEVQAARHDQDDNRRKGLENAIDFKDMAKGLINQGLDPHAFRAAQNKEKELARNAERKKKLQKTIEDMEGRGIKLPNNLLMAKEGFKLQEQANQAAADLAKLNADALKAQKDAAASLKIIETKLQDTLNMR